MHVANTNTSYTLTLTLRLSDVSLLFTDFTYLEEIISFAFKNVNIAS